MNKKYIFAYALPVVTLGLYMFIHADQVDETKTTVKRRADRSDVILNKMSQKNISLYEKVKDIVEKNIINSDKFTSAINQAAEQQAASILQGSSFTPSEPWPPLSDFTKNNNAYMGLMYKLLASKAYYQRLSDKLNADEQSPNNSSSEDNQSEFSNTLQPKDE
jgi:hypothetical protein